ncbi:MAG TPA: hypothetical protein VE591_05580 [Candidatus Acidoferrum sp.]|nr:hypothetical protein [Candidatus Acidoferrum sp.]
MSALSMRADRTTLGVGEIFHMTIHARVREKVGELDELVVPDVGTMQILDDERQTTQNARGTEVVERLTLETTARGRYTFAPPYLDAIDPRDLRPHRFSAGRAVTVVVLGDPAIIWPRDKWVLARSLATFLAAFVVVALVTLALMGRIRPRRERTLVADVTLCLSNGSHAPRAPISSAVSWTPRERVDAALRIYRRSPGTASVETLRAALFDAAGAPPHATAGDALAALRANDASDGDALRGALLAAERTAFGPFQTRGEASRELVERTEAWLGR